MFESILGKGGYIEETVLNTYFNEYKKNERIEFSGPIFDSILKYINNTNLIVSDLDLLLGQKVYWEHIQIFSLDAKKIVEDLLKTLCKNHGNLFILKVSEYDYTYYIEYKLRKICTITNLSIYKRYSIDTLIKPIIINYKNEYNLSVLSALIEIINLYDLLYDPKKHSEWKIILEDINKLESLALKEIEFNLQTEKDILAVSPSFINTKKVNIKKVNKKKENIIKTETLLEFFADSDYLIISNLDNLNSNKLEVLEIISKNSIEYDIDSLQRFLKADIIYREHKLYIPKEHAQTKYNVYIQYNNGKKIIKNRIMSIYNNTTYQLIHYEQLVINGKLYKIADAITIIKFIYISIWTNIVYHRISIYSDKIFREFIKNKLLLLKYYKGKININPETKKNYIGVYINPLTYKKILNIQNLNKGKTNYYCFEIEEFIKK